MNEDEFKWTLLPGRSREMALETRFGRYVIRRMPGRSLTFRAYLNRTETSFYGDNQEQVKVQVERAMRAADIARKRA